jgi:tetratricopeptide (TPR) repeat protein
MLLIGGLIPVGRAAAQNYQLRQPLPPSPNQRPAPNAIDNRETCLNASGDEAINACTNVIANNYLQPAEFAAVFNSRGVAYYEKDDPDHAIADYDDAIRFNPRAAKTFYNRGLAYQFKGDFDRAIADYNAAIRLKRTFAAAFRGRGVAYDAKGDVERALADYDQSIRLDPKDAVTFYNRAQTRRAKGDLDLAVTDYDHSIQLDRIHTRKAAGSRIFV